MNAPKSESVPSEAPHETPAPCRVQVLLFSVLKEAVGASQLQVDLDAPATGEDLLDALADEYPEVEAHRSSLRLAVNEEYVATDTALQDGDEVALITPVSGG